jgi:hypothetical protein
MQKQLFENKLKQERVGDVTQVVESLPSKQGPEFKPCPRIKN